MKPSCGGVFINSLAETAEKQGFDEIMLPLIEPAKIYEDKAGKEILGQMYVFEDRGGRELCLRPEGTATVQLLAKKLGTRKDVKLWYETRCWRYEQPQAGRYREFTQFGIEWLNPRDPEAARAELESLGKAMLERIGADYEWSSQVKRGLAYYVDDGFEASVNSLGAQKQVLGGGSYNEGIGFAVGIDRLMLAIR
tara:strand:+ start:47795 stop:48379 length:585 start_codon:yes stop_codon:yes gene_type:complete